MSSAARAKRERERVRLERAAIKRAKKAGELVGADADDGDTEPVPVGPPRTQDEVLADLAALHRRFDDESIDFEDFEAAKRALMGQLDVG